MTNVIIFTKTAPATKRRRCILFRSIVLLFFFVGFFFFGAQEGETEHRYIIELRSFADEIGYILSTVGSISDIGSSLTGFSASIRRSIPYCSVFSSMASGIPSV